jgi:hypothetical protein
LLNCNVPERPTRSVRCVRAGTVGKRASQAQAGGRRSGLVSPAAASALAVLDVTTRRRAYQHEDPPWHYVTVSPPALLGARKIRVSRRPLSAMIIIISLQTLSEAERQLSASGRPSSPTCSRNPVREEVFP